MDATWDTNQFNEFGELSYDYFALDDEEIANDHDWDINTTPACSYNDFSYFLKNGLFACIDEGGYMIATVRFLMYSWWESSMVRVSHPPLSSSLESKR